MQKRQMKTILLTGSNGLLGQKLVHLIKERKDYHLIATSKGSNRITDQEGYEYSSLDITDKEEVEQIFQKHQPDIVINTAAMTNVDACESDKEGSMALNVTAVEYLIEECKKYSSHLIHLSTDFIFDGEDGPYAEDDLPNPLSFYGQTKLQSEELVKKSGLKWAIVRTIIVYGIAEKMSRSNIVLWAKSALEKGEDLNIVNDQFRAPTLAEDLAKGCLLIADQGAEGVFHISGKDYMSIVELVKRVADFYGYDKSIIQETSSTNLNQAAKRPPKTGFILTKAKKKLGYEPVSFEEGLKIMESQIRK